jgi:hypothetical protein
MRLILPLVTLLLAACASPDTAAPAGTSPGAGNSPRVAVGTGGSAGRPAPTASSPVTIADPHGVWTLGSTHEPAAGPVVACSVLQTLTLTLTDARLQGSVATCAGPCEQLEQLDGNYLNGTATLTGTAKGNLDPNGTPVIYLLKYDVKSQHLRGTRNGQSVWAAPFIVASDDGCRPSPTPDVAPTPQEGTIIPVSNNLPGG